MSLPYHIYQDEKFPAGWCEVQRELWEKDQYEIWPRGEAIYQFRGSCVKCIGVDDPPTRTYIVYYNEE